MLNRLSVRKKILLLFLLPFLITTTLTILLVKSLIIQPLLDVKQAERILSLQKATMNLINELQGERELSGAFLTYAGYRFGDELKQQRERVNSAVKNLPAELQNRLLPIQDVRPMVDQLETTPQDVFNLYSNVIESLLIAIKTEAKRVNNARLFRELESAVLLSYIEENAGKERAILFSVFSKDVMEPSDRDLWYRALTNQESYIRVLSDIAPPQVVDMYSQKVSEQEVERFRAILREKSEFLGVNAEEWFSISAERIKGVEEVQAFLHKLTLSNIQETKRGILASASIFVAVGTPLLILTIILALYLTRKISDSVRDIEKVIREVVEEGRLDRRVEIKSQDELGRMAENLNFLLSSIGRVIEEVREAMASAAAGDFSKRVTSELKGDLMILKEKVNKVVEVMEFIVNSLTGVVNASVEVSRAMEMVEEGTKKQSESTRRMATAVEEISSAVEDTTRSTELASSSAVETYQSIDQSYRLMEGFMKSMEKVREGGDKIRNISEAIQSIAEQVNLLALNAAIEAARAGEQGRGFAVVADEVRRLAEQVGKMASSVRDTVQEVVAAIEGGYRDTEYIYSNFEQVRLSVDRVREMLQRVAVSMEETSVGMREIALNMENLQEVGNNNAVASEEVLSKMVELTKSVENTRKKVEELRG